MTIVFVTTGPWGSGTGAPNSAAQVDGNFYDVDQRIVGLSADVAVCERSGGPAVDAVRMTRFHDSTNAAFAVPVEQ